MNTAHEITTDMELLRLAEVKRMTGLSTTTIYEWGNKGMFPKQIKLGGNTVAWVKSEVQAWIRQKLEAARG
jgi:prophage regulatory protein